MALGPVGQSACLLLLAPPTPPTLQEQSTKMGWDVRGLVALAWTLGAAVAQRAPATSVLYECNQTSLHLVVSMEPWGTMGLSLDPRGLRLGSCPPSFENNRQRLFHFEYPLKACGFARTRSGKTVEYSTYLVYAPPASQSGLYHQPFAERINCTSSEAEWSLSALVPSGTGQLVASSGLTFTAMLMKGDFSAPSNSTVFLLGSQIPIEFAVQSVFHQPLRVFVDECVAAASPELSMSPRNYTVITNYGCVVDGKVANSHFLPRSAPGALRLSLQAFEFLGLHTDIYLHCQVSAWDPQILTDPARKACSFSRERNRWELLDDPASSVCGCCDSACQPAGFRRKRDLRGARMEAGPQQSGVAVGRVTLWKAAQSAGGYEWVAKGPLARPQR